MIKRQQGFTLVEIAIVLVIIGLLLGGILKGQEMITQAKIKNVIADFSGVSAAYHGYQDRYRAIPGDDPNADTRWTVAPAAVKGDGNGIVAGHLQQRRGDVHHGGGVVQLVGSPAQGRFRLGQWPDAALQCGHRPDRRANGRRQGRARTDAAQCRQRLRRTDHLLGEPARKIAIAVDTQMDDGQSNQGTVRALIQVSPNPDITTGTIATASYAETGTNTYVLCRAF